jgi:KaiC/GvpD/RAD55 family RecA-like ATPase
MTQARGIRGIFRSSNRTQTHYPQEPEGLSDEYEAPSDGDNYSDEGDITHFDLPRTFLQGAHYGFSLPDDPNDIFASEDFDQEWLRITGRAPEPDPIQPPTPAVVSDYDLDTTEVNFDQVIGICGIEPEDMSIKQLTHQYEYLRRSLVDKSHPREDELKRVTGQLFRFFAGNEATLRHFFERRDNQNEENHAYLLDVNRLESSAAHEMWSPEEYIALELWPETTHGGNIYLIQYVLKDPTISFQEKANFLQMCARTLPRECNIAYVLQQVLIKSNAEESDIILKQFSVLNVIFDCNLLELVNNPDEMRAKLNQPTKELSPSKTTALSKQKARFSWEKKLMTEQKERKYRRLLLKYQVGCVVPASSEDERRCAQYGGEVEIYRDKKIQTLLKKADKLGRDLERIRRKESIVGGAQRRYMNIVRMREERPDDAMLRLIMRPEDTGRITPDEMTAIEKSLKDKKDTSHRIEKIRKELLAVELEIRERSAKIHNATVARMERSLDRLGSRYEPGMERDVGVRKTLEKCEHLKNTENLHELSEAVDNFRRREMEISRGQYF